MTIDTALMLIEILDAISHSDIPIHEKLALKTRMRQITLAHGVLALEHRERVDAARRLLDDRQPRNQIRARLMVRFDISRSTAYRVISTALKSSHNVADFETR